MSDAITLQLAAILGANTVVDYWLGAAMVEDTSGLVLLSPGEHNFSVRAYDGAMNVDPTPASYTWTIVP